MSEPKGGSTEPSEPPLDPPQQTDVCRLDHNNTVCFPLPGYLNKQLQQVLLAKAGLGVYC